MQTVSRRAFLARSGAVGCSLAASPFVTPVTLAAAPWDARLVVIILRGAMDGLDVVRPYGDPDFAALRPTLLAKDDGRAMDLDGFYGLHPDLAELTPLWDAGELAFAHAVSTPYRDKRSHFDGQDLLEAGTGFDVGPSAVREGWLNRMLQVLPDITAETAYAIGQGELQMLRGAAAVSSWSPGTRLGLSEATRALMARVAEGDPLFGDAFARAVAIADSLEETVPDGTHGGGGHFRRIAEFAALRLKAETRVAAFSITGWDTHANQSRSLARPLAALSETLRVMKDALGPVWGKTAVLAMTEFGRTARENGSRGTDHGTGGAMVLAGGAIRGRRVHGRWPGLGEAELYARRDLMPTQDVRAYAGAAMVGLFGLAPSVIEASVFPGLDLQDPPDILL